MAPGFRELTHQLCWVYGLTDVIYKNSKLRASIPYQAQCAAVYEKKLGHKTFPIMWKRWHMAELSLIFFPMANFGFNSLLTVPRTIKRLFLTKIEMIYIWPKGVFCGKTDWAWAPALWFRLWRNTNSRLNGDGYHYWTGIVIFQGKFAVQDAKRELALRPR